MNIKIIVDNPKSWAIPYAKKLGKILAQKHRVFYADDSDSHPGDIAFYLSCEKKILPGILARNKHNIVIHASKLPKGRGWSPLTWQILEGKNKIYVTLFEVDPSFDTGPIYLQESISFEGHELLDEMRSILGEKIIAQAVKFVSSLPKIKPKIQKGQPTYFKKRLPKDSELDIRKPIKKLFPQLRVADNNRYPAFFSYKEHTYILKIYKGRIPN